MAFIANTAFEARIVNDRFDDLANVAGKFVDSNSDPADCSAGLLVKRSQLLPCEGLQAASVNNENAWAFAVAESTDTIDEPIYACDPHDWPLLASPKGNLFAVGNETLGLGIPAGRYGSFRRIHFDNVSRYRFGVGNADDATGSYFTIDDGMLKADSKPATAGAIYFAKISEGTFTEGTTASFDYIDVIACRVSA